MQPRVEKSNFRFCAIIQIYTEELGGESMRKPQICIKTAYLAKSILSRFAFLQKGGKQTDCLSPPCTLQREHCPPPPSWPALQSRPGGLGENRAGERRTCFSSAWWYPSDGTSDGAEGGPLAVIRRPFLSPNPPGGQRVRMQRGDGGASQRWYRRGRGQPVEGETGSALTARGRGRGGPVVGKGGRAGPMQRRGPGHRP